MLPSTMAKPADKHHQALPGRVDPRRPGRQRDLVIQSLIRCPDQKGAGDRS
jgi:hypothetical protein